MASGRRHAACWWGEAEPRKQKKMMADLAAAGEGWTDVDLLVLRFDFLFMESEIPAATKTQKKG